jgi:hypothetical protein
VRGFFLGIGGRQCVVTLLMNLTNAFRMEVVECPDEEFLADLERVSA